MSTATAQKVRTYVFWGLLAFAVGVLGYAFDDGQFTFNGAVLVSGLLVILAAWVLDWEDDDENEEKEEERTMERPENCPNGPDCDPSEEPCCDGCASGMGPCFGPGYHWVCLTHDSNDD